MKYGECFMTLYHVGDQPDTTYLPSYPDELSDSTSVNWSESGIIGRSVPIYAYTSTSSRNISFSFDLHREMPVSLDSSQSEIFDIENIIKRIRQCAYPTYANSGLKPPIVSFRFGKFRVKGIITNVGFTWKKPIINQLYQLCSVSISMYETPNGVPSAADLASSMNPFNVV